MIRYVTLLDAPALSYGAVTPQRIRSERARARRRVGMLTWPRRLAREIELAVDEDCVIYKRLYKEYKYMRYTAISALCQQAL